MSDKQLIRSFIAIELPPEVKSNISEVQAKIKSSRHNFIKWVSPQSIHLTLKFLGNINSQIVSNISGAIKDASSEVSSFSIEIGGLGVFPNNNRPRVLWLGIGGEVEKLIDLQRRIDDALMVFGFQKEKRPFSPHITLARVRDNATNSERSDFGGLIARTHSEVKSTVEIKSISLMRSQLWPTGAVYTRLAEVKLDQS